MLEAIKLGKYEHDWMTVTSGPIEFRVSADAIKTGGVRGIVTPVELDEVCIQLDCLPPTAYLLDLRAQQATAKTDPVTLWPKYTGAAMSSPQAIKEHSLKVDQQLASKDLSNGVSNVGKHWVYPLEFERLYGWHVQTANTHWRGVKVHPSLVGDDGLKVIQPISNFHAGLSDQVVDGEHEDYSMTAVIVHGRCRVNGELASTRAVYRSSQLHKHVWGSEKPALQTPFFEPWDLPESTIGERCLYWTGYQFGLSPRELYGVKHNPIILSYSKHCRRGGRLITINSRREGVWDGQALPLPLQTDEDPWCAVFGSESLRMGLRPGQRAPHGFRVSVREIASDARALGRLMPPSYEPQAGDLALMGRNGHNPLNGGQGHVRLFIHRLDPELYHGIGGNESNAIRIGPHKFSEVLGWVRRS